MPQVMPVYEDITVTRESAGGAYRILRLRVEDRKDAREKRIVIRTDGLITLTVQEAKVWRERLDEAIATLHSFETQVG